MSDTLALILAAIAAGLTAFIAADPAGLTDLAQAVIGGAIAFLSAVAIKRPGRQATPLR